MVLNFKIKLTFVVPEMHKYPQIAIPMHKISATTKITTTTGIKKCTLVELKPKPRILRPLDTSQTSSKFPGNRLVFSKISLMSWQVKNIARASTAAQTTDATMLIIKVNQPITCPAENLFSHTCPRKYLTSKPPVLKEKQHRKLFSRHIFALLIFKKIFWL